MSDQAVPERPQAVPPDPPHLREDYRDVWLSGWRTWD